MSKSGIMSKNCKNMANNKSQLEEEEIKMETNFVQAIKNVCEKNKNKNIMLLENVDLSYFLTDKNINKDSESRIFMMNEANNTKIIVQTPDFLLEIPFNLDNILTKPINFVKPINPFKYENLLNMNLFDKITKPPTILKELKENKTNDNDKHEIKEQEMIVDNETKADAILHLEKTKQTKNAIKKLKRKNRSMSESDCDVINKVTNHFSELKIITEDIKMDNQNAGQKKIRSMSESGNDDNSKKIERYRGILKHTVYDRSISEESPDFYDDEDTSYSDSKLNENSKKSVRFNEVIRKQLFRANSSILGQRKRNLKKKRSRKLSETENSSSDCEEKKKYYKNMDISNRNI